MELLTLRSFAGQWWGWLRTKLVPWERDRLVHRSYRLEQAIRGLHQEGNPLSPDIFLRKHCRIVLTKNSTNPTYTALIVANEETEYDLPSRAKDAFAIAKAFHRIGINFILVYEPERVLRIQPDTEPDTWSILGARHENAWRDDNG